MRSIVLLLATISTAAAADFADVTMDGLESVLVRRTGCHWDLVSTGAVCWRDIELVIKSGPDGRPESAAMSVFVETTPPEPPWRGRTQRERDRAIAMVQALLPSWTEGPVWLRRAIARAGHECARDVIKRGPITILVHSVFPTRRQMPIQAITDGPAKYAEVVVTRGASLDHWLCAPDCGTCADEP